MLEEVEVAATLRAGVVHGVLTTVTHREAGAPVEVDAHRQPARALVEVKTVDIPGLGQAEGRGEELVVHGALPVVAQGRMRHCASFGPTPACSPGCARQGCAPPGWRPPLTRKTRLRGSEYPLENHKRPFQ